MHSDKTDLKMEVLWYLEALQRGEAGCGTEDNVALDLRRPRQWVKEVCTMLQSHGLIRRLDIPGSDENPYYSLADPGESYIRRRELESKLKGNSISLNPAICQRKYSEIADRISPTSVLHLFWFILELAVEGRVSRARLVFALQQAGHDWAPEQLDAYLQELCKAGCLAHH